jgi:hypothetical protein
MFGKVEFPLMATKSIQQPLPPVHLQRTFENALRDIHQTERSEKLSRQRTPIVQRPLIGQPVSSATAEKQALIDAAKALAQLWKIAPHPTR